MNHYAIIGASGLIGEHLVTTLSNTTASTITLVTRRPLGYANPRIREAVVDFADENALNNALVGVDAVFVAIGTTQKKVNGNMTEYKKVDYDIPLAVAKACVSNSVSKLLIVSSVGANSKSKNFYLRIKGEVEDAIEAMSIPYVGVFQPSLLLGSRKEFRPGERFSQLLMPLFSILLPKRYRPIEGAMVAKAMVHEAMTDQKGVRRYTFADMCRQELR